MKILAEVRDWERIQRIIDTAPITSKRSSDLGVHVRPTVARPAITWSPTDAETVIGWLKNELDGYPRENG